MQGPFQSGAQQKNLEHAMSLLALTNTCFNLCVVKHMPVAITSDNSDQIHTPKLAGVLSSMNIAQQGWLLTEKETICMFNCSKSYVELKEMLHN